MSTQRNISIVSAGTAGVRVTFCSTSYTGSFSCTSYPVFSSSTTGGTSFYAIDSPLRQPLSGSILSANNPAVAYNSTAATALVTFTYGSSFSGSAAEYESGASPRRYRYILHSSGHTPATAFSSAVTSGTAVVLFGSVDMRVVSTAATPFIAVCNAAAEGSVGGGL
jgi:hypothetical protein